MFRIKLILAGSLIFSYDRQTNITYPQLEKQRPSSHGRAFSVYQQPRAFRLSATTIERNSELLSVGTFDLEGSFVVEGSESGRRIILLLGLRLSATAKRSTFRASRGVLARYKVLVI